MSKVILINFSGGDRPGQTSSLTETLAAYRVRILDIGQAVVHETLALAVLVEVPDGVDFSPLKKDLIVRAHELDLKIKFTSDYRGGVPSLGAVAGEVPVRDQRAGAGDYGGATGEDQRWDFAAWIQH